MKRGKWNSTFSCWKEIGAHNFKLNSSLRMGFGLLMDIHKMTLFKKKKEKKIVRTWKK